MKGKIKIFHGPMFSSKTSSLISAYYKWTQIGKKVIIINTILDNRYSNDNKMYTHDGKYIDCIKTENLFDIDELIYKDADIILINEGQFFKDLVEFCLYNTEEKYNKYVIVGALSGTFERKPFEVVSNLMAIADKSIRLYGFCKICNNGNKSLYSKRITDEKKLIVIGSDNYIPVCKDHYYN